MATPLHFLTFSKDFVFSTFFLLNYFFKLIDYMYFRLLIVGSILT